MAFSKGQLTYTSISQRAISSYLRALIPEHEVQSAAELDLQRFFASLYNGMFENPARFGMPLVEDDSLVLNHTSARTQEVTKKLSKPQKVVNTLVQFLMNLGQSSELVAGSLLLNNTQYESLLQVNPKCLATCLNALADLGLHIGKSGPTTVISNKHYPYMMGALQALALGSASLGDPKLAYFNFARCDFKRLSQQSNFTPLDLLTYFTNDTTERALELHRFMVAKGCQVAYRVSGVHSWGISYQTAKKIKATPILELDYSERHQEPLRVQIKCASTSRLMPYWYDQPTRLQQDFSKRAHTCRGNKCGWCESKTNLGPALLQMGDNRRTICWYTNPEMGGLTDINMELIHDYVVWHEQLA